MALPSRAEMGTGDGHQAGLGDQLVAGGLEGAERAWHAACDVLCSMRLARVHGERTTSRRSADL